MTVKALPPIGFGLAPAAVAIETVDQLDDYARALLDSSEGVAPIVYVCHPLGGDQANNVARALEWMRWLLTRWPAVCWIAPWIVDAHVLDDGNEEVRELAIRRCAAVVGLADVALMVGGRMSPGMHREGATIAAAGGSIIDATALGARPPQTAMAARKAARR